MPQTITVRVSNVYGQQTIYPVCQTARLLADLAKQKTFTRRELALIEKLGYRVQVQQVTLPV